MKKELSLNIVSKENKKNNVYDFNIALLKRKREDAIKKISEDSKALKW